MPVTADKISYFARTWPGFVLVLLFVPLALAGLLQTAGAGAARLHYLAGPVATVLALLIVSISYSHYLANRNIRFFFLAFGFAGVLLIDAANALAIAELIPGASFAGETADYAWTWDASRLYLASIMLLDCFNWERRRKYRPVIIFNPRSRFVVFVLSIVLVLSVLITAFQSVTLVAEAQRPLAILLFTAAFAGHLKTRAFRRSPLDYWLLMALMVSIYCEIFHMLDTRGLFPPGDSAATVLKLLSYLFFYFGVLASYQRLFKHSNKSRESLKGLNTELLEEIKSHKQLEEQFAEERKQNEKQRRAMLNIAQDREEAIQQLGLAMQELESANAENARQTVFLNAVLDNMKEGVVACDRNGQLSIFNRAALGLHGKQLERLPHEEWAAHFDLFDKDNKQLGKEDIPLWRAFKGEVIEDYEIIIAPRNTDRHIVLNNGQVIHDNDGNKIGAVVTLHDITEHRTTEIARQAADAVIRRQTMYAELLRQIAIAANEATNVEDSIQVCINEICRYTGWQTGHAYRYESEKHALVSMGIWYFDGSRGLSNFRKLSEWMQFEAGVDLPGRVLLEKEAQWIADVEADPGFTRAKIVNNLGIRAGFAFPVLVNGETYVVLEFFSSRYEEPDEGFIDIMSSLSAQLGRVLERNVTYAALRKSETRMQYFFEASTECLLIVDNRTIVDANDASSSISGCKAADLVGMDIFDFVAPEDLERAAYINRYKPTEPYELTLVRLDGVRIKAQLVGRTMEQSDSASTRFIAIRDITDLKLAVEKQILLNNQLHQAQKMDLVGQLSGGIAHDFNNLLTVILGNTEFLAENMNDLTDQDFVDVTSDIIAAASDGAELTKHLLAFSRVEMLAPKLVSINDQINKLHRILGRTVGKNIEISITETEQDLFCFVDTVQLESALINLVVNSRDAMGDSGTIRFELGRLTVPEESHNDYPDCLAGRYITISVSDTGHGMAAEIIERAIEPFYTTKDIGKGSGLGLSMVYGFTRESGGGMKILSAPGQGTSVVLLLPEVSKNVAGIARDAAVEGSGETSLRQATETILVTEDDPKIRELAVRNLRAEGYRILEAETAVEAKEILASTAGIDLLFSDIVLPGGMSGRELAAWAKKELPDLKIILTTGYSKKLKDKEEIRDEFEVLRKPYRKDELLMLFRSVFDQVKDRSLV